MDNDLRFFLAHDKGTSDVDIDAWRDILTDIISEAYPDEMVTVIAGRDDYQQRASEAGGWKGWPASVVNGCLWNGVPRFHGIIRPAKYVGVMDTVVGRPTFEMVEGFLRLGKNCWVWDVKTGDIHEVTKCERLPGEDFKNWGRLSVREEAA